MSVRLLLEQTEELIRVIQAGEVGRADALVEARKDTLCELGAAPILTEAERAALVEADDRLSRAAISVRNRLADELLRNQPPPMYAGVPPARLFDRQG